MKSATSIWTSIVCALVALAWFGLAEAQYYRHAKPLPPRGLKIDATALAAQSSAASPWQPVAALDDMQQQHRRLTRR